jgi:hypothetical protein
MACFGDVRVAERADWFLDRVAATGSLVIRKVGATRAGERAAHRFLSSPHADCAAVLDTLSARTAKACAGRHIVCVQDTTEINFSGRELARRGLGPGGDGVSKGFFIHPLLAVDAHDEAVLGLAGAQIWTRSPRKTQSRSRRAPEDKESRRWLEGAVRASEVLAQAASLTVIADRESDIYHLFANKPDGVELIVRAAHDRVLDDGGRLFADLAGQAPQARIAVKVASRGPGDKGRIAQVELRSRRVCLRRPEPLIESEACDAVEMTLVEARETGAPAGTTPLVWRILSSAGLDPARIVSLYRLRWRIEQLFRTLKSDGLRLEETQLHDAHRLFLLSAVALGAAARISQLVDARDGSARPMQDVLDPAFKPALEAISVSLEGKTPRQKNPHPLGSLAYLAWVCARLGGWNCYYKPPGPKTMRDGWNALAQQLNGYRLANARKNP